MDKEKIDAVIKRIFLAFQNEKMDDEKWQQLIDLTDACAYCWGKKAPDLADYAVERIVAMIKYFEDREPKK